MEDWSEIATDAIKSLSLTMNFLQDENLSAHFKQQIGGEFVEILNQIKQLSSDKQEKIFAECEKEVGDILRQYVEQIGK